MISFKEKVGYGFGDMASSMFWKLFGTYLMIFYTDVYGLEAAAVGTMFLITRVWDSFFDPFVGILSDRTRSRFGKFRPYLFYVAVPFGVMGIITFFTPDFGHTGKLIYAYITYSLMMMVYSLINVPYASLLGVMSPNPADRTVLSSYRMLFAYLGSLIAYLIFMPMLDIFSGGDTAPEAQQRAWTMAVGVIAVMCIILFIGCGAFTKERVVSEESEEAKRSLKADLRDLLHNKPWWLLFGASVGMLVFFSIRDGATLYYFKYFIVESDIGGFDVFSLSFTLSSLFLAIGQITNIVGVLLAAPVSNRFGKKLTFGVASALMLLLSIAFYYFDQDDLVLIFVFGSLISICGGMLIPNHVVNVCRLLRLLRVYHRQPCYRLNLLRKLHEPEVRLGPGFCHHRLAPCLLRFPGQRRSGRRDHQRYQALPELYPGSCCAHLRSVHHRLPVRLRQDEGNHACPRGYAC